MSVPANWWHDLAAVPAPRPAATTTWMRPDPRPRPAPPVRRPQRPRPALRLADSLVRWGTGLAWVTVGALAGSTLAALAGAAVGAG